MVDVITIVLLRGIMEFFVSSDPFVAAIRYGILTCIGVAMIAAIFGVPSEITSSIGLLAGSIRFGVAAISNSNTNN